MIPTDELMKYLDDSIRYWRRMAYTPTPPAVPRPYGSKAECKAYIDAFQSVRKKFFGETLPL